MILSSHAIPGNEFNVNRVIDGLLRAGAEVIHSGVADVHATGHAQADELKTLPLDRPSPSGSCRSTASTATWSPTPSSAAPMGVPRDHVLVCDDGDVLDARRRRASRSTGRVPAGYLYVDGIVGDVGQGVLRDRRVLAEEGVVVVVVTVDVETRQGAHRPGDHHPRLGVRARGRGPARRGVRHGRRGGRARARRTACATSRRSSATCAGPPGSSSASAPGAAR